jgi:hypothetical protein
LKRWTLNRRHAEASFAITVVTPGKSWRLPATDAQLHRGLSKSVE